MTAAADRDALKQAAARRAGEEVRDGMVVGLGTGSTASFAVTALGERVGRGLRILGIPTSERTADLARRVGIVLTSFAEHPRIDLTIDGADEVERGTLNLIKGLGGALLREKIVAAASARVTIIVDQSKLVDRLGSRVAVPVEVVPFGWEVTAGKLAAQGATVTRRTGGDGGPYVTDGGNLILDCAFGPIADAPALADRLARLVGVVETGLFIGLAQRVIVAGAGGISVLERT